jgi:DNA-binding ferritin-like protein (Dps family)
MLNKKNKTLLNEMRFYIQSSSAVPDTKASEILMELEDHLLMAQREGKSFEQVFGQDPKSYCNEIIKELPKSSKWEQIKTIAPIVPLLLFWRFLNGFSGHLTILLYENIVYLALSLALSYVLFTILRAGSFSSKRISFWMMYGLGTIISLVYVGFFLVSDRILPAEPHLILHDGAAYITATVSLVIILYSLFGALLKKKR